jgi:ribosomal protein S18 acetylase RimI-like enzyme
MDGRDNGTTDDRDVTLTILPLDPASPMLKSVIALYNAVWGKSGAGATSADAQIRRHAGYPGFKAVVALTPEGQAVGFAYGYTNTPGQWWHERVAENLGAERTARELTGSFCVTELAVMSSHRRRGLGRRLLAQLLADLPHRAATLSTQRDNLAARALYEAAGWDYLIERMRFVPGDQEWVVMRRRLR